MADIAHYQLLLKYLTEEHVYNIEEKWLSGLGSERINSLVNLFP